MRWRHSRQDQWLSLMLTDQWELRPATLWWRRSSGGQRPHWHRGGFPFFSFLCHRRASVWFSARCVCPCKQPKPLFIICNVVICVYLLFVPMLFSNGFSLKASKIPPKILCSVRSLVLVLEVLSIIGLNLSLRYIGADPRGGLLCGQKYAFACDADEK